MQVTIDATDFQEADQGDTSCFGGVVVVSDGTTTESVQCTGTDRDSYNCFDAIIDAAFKMLGIEWADDSEEYNAFYDDVNFKVSVCDVFKIELLDGGTARTVA